MPVVLSVPPWMVKGLLTGLRSHDAVKTPFRAVYTLPGSVHRNIIPYLKQQLFLPYNFLLCLYWNSSTCENILLHKRLLMISVLLLKRGRSLDCSARMVQARRH